MMLYSNFIFLFKHDIINELLANIIVGGRNKLHS